MDVMLALFVSNIFDNLDLETLEGFLMWKSTEKVYDFIKDFESERLQY